MQFPNTLLQTFLKSYSSLDFSGPLNNISRLCYTNLSFTPTPQHSIILTDIGSPPILYVFFLPLSRLPAHLRKSYPQNIYFTLEIIIIHVWVTAVFIVFENFICAYFHHIALGIMSFTTCILILMYLLNFEKALDQISKLH